MLEDVKASVLIFFMVDLHLGTLERVTGIRNQNFKQPHRTTRKGSRQRSPVLEREAEMTGALSNIRESAQHFEQTIWVQDRFPIAEFVDTLPHRPKRLLDIRLLTQDHRLFI